MQQPVLFVDVDGVISLFGFEADAPPPGRFQLVDGIPHYLSATAGEHLRRLSSQFETVWCTGWEEKAPEHLPHALGLLDAYPHLTFARSPRQAHAHWKIGAIDAYAGARPLAWIDDAHDDECGAWARAREQAGAPTLLVTTDPATGIAAAHVEALTAWAARL
ncbi:HAD domain-containing protein [Conexibacter arvalis]|uniref:Secreted protein n=1 Tax=Conexibacter arvalis TaxID=912552 RepID=A0A840IG46_9ACTN|nr:HAD domain-containing protein [Conexibacter arvalis]MBB4662938.1 hypothetical protein [Conexibacter arvalis]